MTGERADRIELAAAARRDVDSQLDYLAERNPAAALALSGAIAATLAMLAQREPRFDGPDARLTTGERCRRVFVHPVAIYYQRAPEVLTVLRVYHHAREPIARE